MTDENPMKYKIVTNQKTNEDSFFINDKEVSYDEFSDITVPTDESFSVIKDGFVTTYLNYTLRIE